MNKFLEKFQGVGKKLQNLPLLDVILQQFNSVGNMHRITNKFTDKINANNFFFGSLFLLANLFMVIFLVN